MRLIDGSRVTLVEIVPEARLRDALVLEVAEAHGLVTDGALTKGVSGRVLAVGQRGEASAGYRVEVTFNRAEAGQASLPAPKAEGGA